MRHPAKYYLVILSSLVTGMLVPGLVAMYFHASLFQVVVLMSVLGVGIGFPLDRAIDNSWRGTAPIAPDSESQN